MIRKKRFQPLSAHIRCQGFQIAHFRQAHHLGPIMGKMLVKADELQPRPVEFRGMNVPFLLCGWAEHLQIQGLDKALCVDHAMPPKNKSADKKSELPENRRRDKVLQRADAFHVGVQVQIARGAVALDGVEHKFRILACGWGGLIIVAQIARLIFPGGDDDGNDVQLVAQVFIVFVEGQSELGEVGEVGWFAHGVVLNLGIAAEHEIAQAP